MMHPWNIWIRVGQMINMAALSQFLEPVLKLLLGANSLMILTDALQHRELYYMY